MRVIFVRSFVIRGSFGWDADVSIPCMRFHFDMFTIYQSIEGAESIYNR